MRQRAQVNAAREASTPNRRRQNKKRGYKRIGTHKFGGGNYFIGEDNSSAIRRVRRARAAIHFEWGPRHTHLLFCSILNDHEQLDSRMCEVAEIVIIVVIVVDDVKIVVVAPIRRPWLGVCKPVATILKPTVVVPPMRVKIVRTSKMVVVIPVGNHAPAVSWMYVASLIAFVLVPRPLLLCFLTSLAFLLPGVRLLLVFPPFGILTGTVLFLLGLLRLRLPLLQVARPVFLLRPLLFLLGAFLPLLLSVPLLNLPRPVRLLGFLLLLLGPFVLLFFLVLLILLLVLFCLFLLLWFLLRICKARHCDKET